MQDLALYGGFRNRPIWLVKRRGFAWLRSGFCPCCYSSPPRDDCPICHGDQFYGPGIARQKREEWRVQWSARCASRAALMREQR